MAPLQATQSDCRPDEASFPHMACAAAYDDAPHAFWHNRPSPLPAIAAWSRCSPTRTHIAAAGTRGSASRSNPCGGSVLANHPDDLVDRHTSHRRSAKAAIRKSGMAFLLIAPTPTPELPLRTTQKLTRFLRRKFPVLPAPQYIRKLRHPAFL